MNDIKHFTDLQAWQVNHENVKMIYKITQRFPKEERFGMIDQRRRVSSSVMANIAEGWGRYHYADRIRFYYQARGSAYEVENFLLLARDLEYISREDSTKIIDDIHQGCRVINGLIRSLEERSTRS